MISGEKKNVILVDS